MKRLAAVALSALLLAFGCADDAAAPPPTGPARLVNPFDWTLLAAADDPFADHRPADAPCPEASFGGEPFSEQYALEIRTGPGGCRWLSAAQPARTALAAGDPITIRVWHFELTAETRAEAHVALAIGGETIWQRSVVIPSEGALLLDTVDAPRAWPTGTPVVFHLHNHGANTWNLLEVIARPEEANGG